MQKNEKKHNKKKNQKKQTDTEREKGKMTWRGTNEDNSDHGKWQKLILHKLK